MALTFIKVIRKAEFENGKTIVTPINLYRCECGKLTEKNPYHFSSKSDKGKRCRDCSKKLRSAAQTKHGLVKHPLYRKWQDMLNRCRRPEYKKYYRYGGRGISVFDEWVKDFKAFYDWSISNGYQEGLTIDRIDVNGDYEPSNCRYITIREQGYNKENTFYIIVDGNTVCAKEWVYDNGLNQAAYKKIWYYYKKHNQRDWSKNELLKLAKTTRKRKWSREELIEIRDKYRQRLKLMK